MATVVYLVLDRETGEVSYSCAGHPPPLVLTPDGPHFLEGGRSVPIGASDPAVFREASAVIPPGSSLLLYTDGLVERRDVGLEERLGQLAAVAGAAGHPPPLVLTPDGPIFLEGGRSVPIGAADPAVFREASAVLPPGSTLLLYTDGLVERRDVGLEERLGRLAEVAGSGADDLDALCDRVIQVVLGDGDPGDDVALLAVRPLPAASERINLTLPAEPGSLAGLRRRLARFLHATGASEAEQYELTLTICEAAGNAIEHAYGPGDATYEVEVTFADGELVATVRDNSTWRDKRDEHHGRGLRIIEELMDEVQVLSQEDGTVVTMRRRIPAARAA